MDFNTALQKKINHLEQNRGATNNVLIEIIGGDEELFQKVREHLIFTDLAKDKKGVGLIFLDHEVDEPETVLGQSPTPDLSQSLRIFISYGRKDAEPLAKRLEKDLASQGHNVWLDISKMQSGASWEGQIEEAILSHDVFISLLTPHAVRRPNGVCLDEISMARFHNRKIVPVMVIRCRPPLSIYRLDWVDFMDWHENHIYERSFERVVKAIYSQDAVEGLYAELFSNLKPLDFGVDISRLTMDFTGRQWLFDEVDHWLKKPSSKLFFITGDPGTGKSAVMAHLASRHSQVMAYHFCIASLADSLNPDSFVRSLAAQLSTQIKDYHDAIKQLNFEQLTRLDSGTLFRRIIADPLKSIQLKEKVVILIDALDEGWKDENHNIVRILHERLEDLPDMVKVIVSSRKNPGIFDLLSKYKPHEIDPARTENIYDISAYLDKQLNKPAIKANLPQKASLIQSIKQSVISKSEGNFLYIKQFIYGIETDQININDETSYPDGLIGIYTNFFDRIFTENEHYTNYRSVLEVITCLKVPYSAMELAPIVQLSEFEIRRKMQTLSAFFSVQDGKYFPYHKSITDWLTGTAGSGSKYLLDMENGRQKLSEFLLKRYEEEDYNPYLLAYLPYHLMESRRYQELTDLLLDFRFIIQKCRQGLVYELIKDYHAAFAVIPETRIIKKEEKEYIERMAKYTRHLVSDPDRVLEEEICLESSTPWSEWQIEAELERIKTSPTIKDKLIIFLQFLDSQAHLLYRHGSLAGYVLQQAYNYAGTGPFASLVDSYMQKCSHPKLLFTRELREEFNPFDPCLRVFHEHTERVLGVSLTFDGKYAVTGSNDNLLKLWDMQSGECLKTICPHSDYLKSLDATPDLNLVVSSGGSQDPTIRLWNYKDLEPRGILQGHTDRVNHLKITPNGRYVISCSNDNTVKVWDSTNLQCIADLKDHTAEVVSVDISIDGKIAASGGYDNTIYIWDVPSRKVLRSIKGNSEHGIIGYALKLSHNKKILYSSAGYDDSSIKAWDLITGNCITTLRGNEYARDCLEVTHDRQFLVAASMDKTISIWNLNTETCIKTIRGHIGPIRSLKITPDLKYIISGGGGKYDSTVRVWNIFKSKLSDDTTVSRNIREIHFAPAGEFILNLTRKIIQIRDPVTSNIKTELNGHRSHVKQVCIHPDGNIIISASLDKTIRLWNLQTNECYGLLAGHTDGILDIGLSQDYKKLLSCGWDGQIIEWDLDNQKQIRTYQDKGTCFIYVAYVHNNKHILSIGNEDSLKIWDVVTGKILYTHQCPVHITSRTTPDSLDNLYLGQSDGSIQFWNTHKYELRPTCQGHNELVSCLELVESEQYLFSGSSDCTIRQWDITTGDCLCIFEGHTDEIISIRKIPGQDKIISASWDHSIRVWEIHSRKCVAVLSTNLLVTSLTEVQDNGRFAYGTIQGEFKIINLNLS